MHALSILRPQDLPHRVSTIQGGCIERRYNSPKFGALTMPAETGIQSRGPRTRTWQRLGSVLITVAIAAPMLACTHASPGAHIITLTLIRHAESEGNVSGRVDTSVPGPGLTAKGRGEARTSANTAARQHYDGIFASSMIRTQQTASYLAAILHEPVQVLPGLREIEAGRLESSPTSTALKGYFGPIAAWLHGHREVRIPGSVDGIEFDKRFDEAVAAIYGSGDSHPVAYSHGGAIAAWTLMNVTNADPNMLTADPLPNTGYVVVQGAPGAGWKLIDWNGRKFGG
jgi:broad specificity phosphatase PhoE